VGVEKLREGDHERAVSPTGSLRTEMAIRADKVETEKGGHRTENGEGGEKLVDER